MDRRCRRYSCRRGLDESLLHRTPEIEAFLSPERDDKFIVVGTKGFGKPRSSEPDCWVRLFRLES